jgi:Type VI secretion system effector, Hcp
MAVDIFLVIPPVPTVPSTQPPVSADPVADQYFATAFKGAAVVEVRELSLGEETPSTVGSATTGAGAGKAKLNDLVIVKSVDKLSRSLYAMSVTGRHFQHSAVVRPPGRWRGQRRQAIPRLRSRDGIHQAN